MTGVLKFDACFPDSVVGFRPSENVTVNYIQCAIDLLRPQIEKAAPQLAQKNINLKILRALRFPVPPIADQRLFSYLVLDIRASSMLSTKATEMSEGVATALLNQAFQTVEKMMNLYLVRGEQERATVALLVSLEDIDALLAADKRVAGRASWGKSRETTVRINVPLSIGDEIVGGLFLKGTASVHNTPQDGSLIPVYQNNIIERMNVCPPAPHPILFKNVPGLLRGRTLLPSGTGTIRGR